MKRLRTAFTVLILSAAGLGGAAPDGRTDPDEALLFPPAFLLALQPSSGGPAAGGYLCASSMVPLENPGPLLKSGTAQPAADRFTAYVRGLAKKVGVRAALEKTVYDGRYAFVQVRTALAGSASFMVDSEGYSVCSISNADYAALRPLRKYRQAMLSMTDPY